jgi:hypothetical protein
MQTVNLHSEDKPHIQFDCNKGIHDWSKWSKKWFQFHHSQHRKCEICNLEQIVETYTLETKNFIK